MKVNYGYLYIKIKKKFVVHIYYHILCVNNIHKGKFLIKLKLKNGT